MPSNPMIHCKLWKPISPFHMFQYPNGQLDITSLYLRIIRFQNFYHHYKWENVYFCDIPRTQFWPCAQKSLILTEWVSFWQNGSHLRKKEKKKKKPCTIFWYQSWPNSVDIFSLNVTFIQCVNYKRRLHIKYN